MVRNLVCEERKMIIYRGGADYADFTDKFYYQTQDFIDCTKNKSVKSA